MSHLIFVARMNLDWQKTFFLQEARSARSIPPCIRPYLLIPSFLIVWSLTDWPARRDSQPWSISFDWMSHQRLLSCFSGEWEGDYLMSHEKSCLTEAFNRYAIVLFRHSSPKHNQSQLFKAELNSQYHNQVRRIPFFCPNVLLPKNQLENTSE